MSQYRRSYVPGGVYFLTLVTYRQIPLFSDVENIFLLRLAIAKMPTEKPFDITNG
jgi:putative transposase